MGRKLIDITGQVFNGITAIEWSHKVGLVNYWKFQCHCGTYFSANAFPIRTGRSKSCGCLRGQLIREKVTKHGMSKHILFPTFINMKQRCYNSEFEGYSDYGGRGIKVCDRWLEPDGKGFLNFLEDMGERPDGMSLDRIDVNGHYDPLNCRWTDWSTQSFNQRKNKTSNTVRIGIRYDAKNNKWRASINYNGKAYHLYYGKSLEVAIKRREDAEIKYFGSILEYCY